MLKRKQFHAQINRVVNNQVHVIFPMNFTLHTRGAFARYTLQAVTVHGGNASGGHYTAYARGTDGTWYYYDDACEPRPVSAETVQGAQAYMLIYERDDLPAPYSRLEAPYDWRAFEDDHHMLHLGWFQR